MRTAAYVPAFLPGSGAFPGDGLQKNPAGTPIPFLYIWTSFSIASGRPCPAALEIQSECLFAVDLPHRSAGQIGKADEEEMLPGRRRFSRIAREVTAPRSVAEGGHVPHIGAGRELREFFFQIFFVRGNQLKGKHRFFASFAMGYSMDMT